MRFFVLLCMIASLCMWSASHAEHTVELRGFVAAKTVDCLDPAHHDHDPEFYLVDDKTGKRVQLTGYEMKLKSIHPRQKVRIKILGRGKTTKTTQGRKTDQPTQQTANGSQLDGEILEFEILPYAEEESAQAEQEPPVAMGENSLTMLSTLLVFISTNTHGCMTSETNARNRLFNNSTNANLGMQAITKGRYGLQLGNGTGVPSDHIINLQLNVNSADHDTSSIENLAISKLFNSASSGGMGLNRLSWNRILLFAPDGITDKGFTAYAYYPWGAYTTHGLVSMYGKSYGNNYMSGYLHELGHNFGFAHSSKGSSEYGDRTCVMGVSNDGTKTETYNVAKLLNTDWLNVFPNAKKSLTTDATIDIYPLSSDPNVVTGTIAVSFPGTTYYAAYHRNQAPYGSLLKTADRDKVFVYTRGTGTFDKSFQVANIAVGTSFTGPGNVIFERYGPNNEYATVSFDLNDGNTKPVAIAQSVSLEVNQSKAINLSGSDSDNDPLNYSLVTSPSQGTLGGAPPNLTYTPTSNYIGSDSFVFKIHDGKISSFAAVSITVTDSSTGLGAFTIWATPGGEGITFTGDSNADSLADGMAWLLGANNPTQNASGLLPQPTATTNGDLSLNFKMLNNSKRGTAALRLESSRDLGFTDPWTSNVVTIPDVSDTVGGVAFTISPINGTDYNQVVATIPAAAANGTGKLFVRLSGIISP